MAWYHPGMRKLGTIAATAAVAVTVLAAAGCSKASDPAPQPRKHEDRREPMVASAPALRLTVAIDGTTTTWGRAEFDRVPRYTGNDKASDGESRDVWSLRQLVRTLVAPTARVTSVTGDGGASPIEPGAWTDTSHEPVLHTTRRGTLKFRWADATGAWCESEVRDVTRIDVTR